MFCGISSNTGTLTCRYDNYQAPRSLLTEESVRGPSVQGPPRTDGLRPDGCSTKGLRGGEISPSAVAISASSLSLPTAPPIVVQHEETVPTPQNSQETNSKAALGPVKIHELVLSDPALSTPESLATTQSRSDAESQPSSEVCSPVLKPLAQQWHFPLHESFYKSTPGALDRLTQEEFEDLVTKGIIIEDEKGFQWAANHRYLLYKSSEEMFHGTCSKSRLSNHIQTGQCHHQILFSRPSLNESFHIDTKQQLDTDPGSSDLRPLYQRRGIRKLLNPIPTAEPTRLPSPWRFPPDALYIEAFPRATQNLSQNKIESMVTRGILIACSAGIRDAGTDLYQMYYVGERDKGSKQHVPRITKCRAVGNPAPAEKPPTPIVEEIESGMGMMMTTDKTENRRKKVRFSHRMRCLDPWGGGGSEDIRDNEGFSSSLTKDIVHAKAASPVGASSNES